MYSMCIVAGSVTLTSRERSQISPIHRGRLHSMTVVVVAVVVAVVVTVVAVVRIVVRVVVP